MKTRIYISTLQRLIVIAFAGITLLGSISYSFANGQEDQKSTIELEMANEDDSTENTTPEFSAASFQAIINFIHIDLHFTSYLIQEQILEPETNHFPVFQQPIFSSGYFKTLFRRIISPNAP